MQTEIDEWSLPKAYADCTSADCATVRIDWEEGKTRIVLPIVHEPGDAASLFAPA